MAAAPHSRASRHLHDQAVGRRNFRWALRSVERGGFRVHADHHRKRRSEAHTRESLNRHPHCTFPLLSLLDFPCLAQFPQMIRDGVLQWRNLNQLATPGLDCQAQGPMHKAVFRRNFESVLTVQNQGFLPCLPDESWDQKVYENHWHIANGFCWPVSGRESTASLQRQT